jgi:predicted ATPase
MCISCVLAARFVFMHLSSVSFDISRYPVSDEYPFNLELLCETAGISFTAPVTFFVGENGSGKTTVLKGICRKCGIHIWQDEARKRYRNNPYEDDLYRYMKVEWTDGPVPGSYFGSQIFEDFTRFLDDWAAATPDILKYYGGESLMTKSHGQSLMAYFRSRYKIKGMYFLDEPEAALSPTNQLAFLDLLGECVRDGHAQFIIATQSPIIMSCPGAVIYSFDSVPLRTVDYLDTEHYRIYRDFLNKGCNE